MSISVAAIQLKYSSGHSPQEIFDCVREPIEPASASGAQLVVLPNIPVSMPRDMYVDFFSALAQRLRIFLAPGSILESDGKRLYNTACLFTPDGKVVGAQRQTHRSPQEIASGLAQGDELYVFDIDIARVGFVIGTDVEYPEVSRILVLQGANVLIHPASYAKWSREHYLLDLWREVQSNQVFNGIITNDKFCMSRTTRLHLTWWRRALRSRPARFNGSVYPSDETSRRGGTHETSVENPPSID